VTKLEGQVAVVTGGNSGIDRYPLLPVSLTPGTLLGLPEVLAGRERSNARKCPQAGGGNPVQDLCGLAAIPQISPCCI
jgi:hypothetical protein